MKQEIIRTLVCYLSHERSSILRETVLHITTMLQSHSFSLTEKVTANAFCEQCWELHGTIFNFLLQMNAFCR
jgi:hypothetical protein